MDNELWAEDGNESPSRQIQLFNDPNLIRIELQWWTVDWLQPVNRIPGRIGQIMCYKTKDEF